MDPVLLHVILLGAFRYGNVDTVVTHREQGHAKTEICLKTPSSLDGNGSQPIRHECVVPEEILPQTIFHKKTDNGFVQVFLD